MVRSGGEPFDAVIIRLNAARARSEPSAIVVRGGSPSARSGLVAAAVGRARSNGFKVLHAGRRPDGIGHAHGGLIELLSGHIDRIDELPAIQANALRAALRLTTTDIAPTPVAVQAATLALLGVLADEAPVLLAIDCDYSLDRSTAEVIGFTARRLVAEPVVVLVAADIRPDPFAGFDEVHVDGTGMPTPLLPADPTPMSESFEGDADELEAAARRARACGALLEAGPTWVEAARRSRTGALTARRFFEAGTDYWMAGCVDVAIEQYARAADAAAGRPDLLAEISLLAGQAIGWHRSPSEAVGCLHTAATHADEASTAAACIAHAAVFASVSGDIGHAVGLAERAAARAPAIDPVATTLSTAVLGWQQLLTSDPTALDRLAPLITLAPVVAATGGADCLTLAQLIGYVLVILERWEEASSLLDTIHRRARLAGWQAASAFSAAALGLVDWRRGHWDAAYATATEGVNDAVNGNVARAWAQSFLARITAGMGREAETRRLASDALATGEHTGAAMVSFAARAALGHLELSLGRLDDALEELDVVAARVAVSGLLEPGVLWWELDHLEALALAGRASELSAGIDRLDTIAARTGRRWAAGVVAHARGMAEPGAEAEAWFDLAVAGFEELDTPFERARTMLRRGQSRLARRHTAAGRADLDEACREFGRLAATLWAEVAATSCRRRRGSTTARRPLDRLTGAELRVALAASRGMKNREIAAELYLSEKTVDHHLQSIYRTLQVRSRTELAILLSTTQPSTPSLSGTPL